jgi:hypothetical protein
MRIVPIKKVLKGRYHAIVISIILHALLLLWIINSASSVPHIPPLKHKAIQSFLYQPKPVEAKVVPPVVDPIIDPVEVPQTKVLPKLTEEKADISPIKQPDKKQDTKQNNEQGKKTEKVQSATPPSIVQQEKVTSVVPKNFSAAGQIDKLRNRINQSMIEKEQADFLQFKSPSVMHGTPTPVPHAEMKLSDQQKKEKNTTRYADGISITKNDNGTCTTELDLSNVGMEGHSAILLSACGESKFDKSFREHMKKVSEKLSK